AGCAAVADLGAVEAAHAGDAETRGCEEHLFGVRRVEEIDVPFHYWNGELTRELEVGWSTFRPPQTAAYAAFCVLLLLWRLHKRVLQISPADPSFRDAILPARPNARLPGLQTCRLQKSGRHANARELRS